MKNSIKSLFVIFLGVLFVWACDSDLPMVEESLVTPLELTYNPNDTVVNEVESRFGRKPIFFTASSTLDTWMFGNQDRDQIAFNTNRVDSITLNRVSTNPYPDAILNGTRVYTNNLTVFYDDGTQSSFLDVYATNALSSHTYEPVRNFYSRSALKMVRHNINALDQQDVFDIRYGYAKRTVLQDIYDFDNNLLASEYILSDHPFARIWNMPHEY